MRIILMFILKVSASAFLFIAVWFEMAASLIMSDMEIMRDNGAFKRIWKK